LTTFPPTLTHPPLSQYLQSAQSPVYISVPRPVRCSPPILEPHGYLYSIFHGARHQDSQPAFPQVDFPCSCKRLKMSSVVKTAEIKKVRLRALSCLIFHGELFVDLIDPNSTTRQRNSRSNTHRLHHVLEPQVRLSSRRCSYSPVK
jgi:hypothetical protein